jgi:Kef-type K+ transport system membrane component KefB/Trk K+ transport system NAD-binding subunit
MYLMIVENTFFEIAAILSLATLMGIIGRKVRQPLIIMFLAAGILAGPSCLGLIKSHQQIELLAQIGIALLLFIVGLKLDWHLIRTTGLVSLATGLGQIIFTSLIGFGIALGLGMSVLPAAYVAVALTFSSTIIIVKLLSDKKEIDSLHGQISIGFLIVQDIAAIIALIGLTTLGTTLSEGQSIYGAILAIVAKGFGFLGVVVLLMKFVLPGLLKRLASSIELLTLFAIAWAVFLSATSEYLGFSKEVGAFVAGVSLASTGFRDSIGSRLTSLRDFLLLFFFIDLGARLDWSIVGSQLGASVLLSLFVLIGNPLIVLIIMGIMGYRRRTGFLAGLTVAQISEFSLIVAALGVSLGHIHAETMGLITLVGVVTIFASTYMILYSGRLYNVLSGPLKLFERRHPYREGTTTIDQDAPARSVILLGLGNYGSAIAEDLLLRKKNLIGVDFDPVVIEKWRSRDMSVIYGDVGDPDLLEQLPLANAEWIASTLRSRVSNLLLLHNLKYRGFGGKVALTATNQNEASEFEKAGAHLVFRPFIDAAELAANALGYATDFLPVAVDWPIAFLEVRIRPDAAVAGQRIKAIALRSMTPGVSILTVIRAGNMYYDPNPDLQIYPGDRLLIMGPPAELKNAESALDRPDTIEHSHDAARFEVTEITLADDSPLAGKSLAELRFRQSYGATLVGIRRGHEQITNIDPREHLVAGDSLIVIGTGETVADLKKKGSL